MGKGESKGRTGDMRSRKGKKSKGEKGKSERVRKWEGEEVRGWGNACLYVLRSKKVWQRKMGKEKRIRWNMWVKEREMGCRGGFWGLPDGWKHVAALRKRLFRTAVLPVWMRRTYHITTWNGLFRKAKKPVRQHRKVFHKRWDDAKHCATRHCVKSARIAYLRPEEARRTNTRPIRSWREYLFIARKHIMYVYAFMLRCRHCYAAPFSA